MIEPGYDGLDIYWKAMSERIQRMSDFNAIRYLDFDVSPIEEES